MQTSPVLLKYFLTGVMKQGRCAVCFVGGLGSKDSIREVRIHIVQLTVGLTHLFFFFLTRFFEIQFTDLMIHAFKVQNWVVSGKGVQMSPRLILEHYLSLCPSDLGGHVLGDSRTCWPHAVYSSL